MENSTLKGALLRLIEDWEQSDPIKDPHHRYPAAVELRRWLEVRELLLPGSPQRKILNSEGHIVKREA